MLVVPRTPEPRAGLSTVLEMSDDRESQPTPVLASDAERERSIALLRDAVGEGRLTLEEFSERVGHAQAARTDQELARLARDLPGDPAAPTPPTAASEQHRAFCSHLVRSGPWSLPPQSSWRSIFGTIDLDLRQARLAGPETALEVFNLFGTVTVIVPEGVEVVVRGGGLFASQKIESPERPPIASGPRLTIDTRGPGGTLHVRTRRFRAVRGVIEQDLDTRVQDVFAAFEEERFAIASLGQVYRARTRDGEHVAVKVQHPDIGDAIDRDLRTIGLLSPIVTRLLPGCDAGALLSEVRERIADELDYEVEAQQQRRLARRPAPR